MSEAEPLEKSVVKAIADSGGLELAVDAAEVSLDQLLTDGVLRDVPIVGGLVNLYKAGIGVRNYLFVRKVARFLAGPLVQDFQNYRLTPEAAVRLAATGLLHLLAVVPTAVPAHSTPGLSHRWASSSPT